MIPHTYSFPAFLTIFIMFYPSQLKPLFNTILIMFFICFLILSYSIQPHATKPYGKPSKPNLSSSCLQIIIPYGSSTLPIKSWVFNSRFSFNVRQHGQQQLYFQYKICWILSEMVDDPSFSQPYLWIQQPLQSKTKIVFSTSVKYHLPFLPLLLKKIILTIHTNTPFLYTAAFFHLSIFAYNHPTNLHQKCFPYLSHLANSGCAKGQRSYVVF